MPRPEPALLLLMVLMPWLFVVVNQSAIYDSWRHYYFIYPPMVILAGITGIQVYPVLRQPLARTCWIGIGLLGLGVPIRWSIRNHPLEHVYFNELVGGIKGAYGRFETEYYGDGLRLASEKLLRHLQTHERNRPITIAENTPTQLRYYLEKGDPGLRIQHMPYEQRDAFNWEYGVFGTRGLDRFRKRTDWPPAGMIDSVAADGVLLYAIVKQHTRQDTSNRSTAGYRDTR
jgi:hypothetical protein